MSTKRFTSDPDQGSMIKVGTFATGQAIWDGAFWVSTSLTVGNFASR